LSGFKLVIEWFSVECRKTKTKPITYQLDYSANLFFYYFYFFIIVIAMHTTIYTTFITILYYFTIHNKQDLRYNITNSHSLTYTHYEQVYIAKSHLFEPNIF